MIIPLEGTWRAELPGFAGDVRIPGTLDESGIGHRDVVAGSCHPTLDGGAIQSEGPIATRLTRRHTYEGAVRLSRRVGADIPEDARVFFEVERARCLRLFVDGTEVAPFGLNTLSAPQVFEVTGLLRKGSELALISDNGYPGLPREDIVNASAATDETQTNWNGLLGYVRLRLEAPVFVRSARVYPRGDALDIRVDLSAGKPYSGHIQIACDALDCEKTISVDVPAGEHEISARATLAEAVRRWDEYDGRLYEMTLTPENCEPKTIRFGVRRFGDDGTGRLAGVCACGASPTAPPSRRPAIRRCRWRPGRIF